MIKKFHLHFVVFKIWIPMINTPLVAYVRYMRIEIVDRHARGLEKKTVVSHEEILSRSSSCFLPLVSSTTRV